MTARPKRWTETTIDAICRLTNGKVFKPSDWSSGGLPIIRIQNLNNPDAPFNFYDGPVESRHRIVAGDLLFAWSGTPGTSFGAHIWRGGEAVLNQHIFKIEFDRTAVDPEYLCHAINETLEEQVSKAHGGVGLRHVTRGAFASTKVPIPPYEEQVRLARVITSLKARASAIRQAALDTTRLGDTARLAVLAAAFEGELTRAWRAVRPKREPVKALLARTPGPDQSTKGREATSRIVPGRAGISLNEPDVPLPEGWAWVPLVRLARQESGHTPSRRNPDYWGGNIPWLGIRDASNRHGQRVTDTEQKTTPAGLANSSARLLPAGTVCLSRTASLGYVTILGVDMATSQDFAAWTCGEALLPDYLMYALMSEGDEIRQFAEGSVHLTIYLPEIRAFHIRLAPFEEQKEIVRVIQAALRRIHNLLDAAHRVVDQIDELDRRIVAQAFAGNLTRAEPGDGSAEALLGRIVPPQPITERSARRSTKSMRESNMSKTVEEVLAAAPEGLSAQEAFRQCGVGSGAELEAIEQLYSELRQLDQDKKLLTEPVFDAEGRKIEDRLLLAR